MMMVPTYVAQSRIEGVGVFAAKRIAKGELIWVLDERFDLLLPDSELTSMPILQRQFFERYSYPHMTKSGLLVLEFDHGKFMNHSKEPNTDFRNPETAWAIREIAKGEEITCDYSEFDPGFKDESAYWAAGIYLETEQAASLNA